MLELKYDRRTGLLVEYDLTLTHRTFANSTDERSESYVAGRLG